MENKTIKCIDDRRAQGTLKYNHTYEMLDIQIRESKDHVRRTEVQIVNETGGIKWYDATRFVGWDASDITTGFAGGAVPPKKSKYIPVVPSMNMLRSASGRIEPTMETAEVTESTESKEASHLTQATTTTKRMTLRGYLDSQGVAKELIDDMVELRKEYGVDDAVMNRVIKRPSALYQGGEVWSACIAALLNGSNLLLTGEKATGKNVLAENLAFAFGRPMWDISMHVNIDAGSLIGSDTFRNGEVVFKPGSVYNAAKYGGFGVLDEVNMAKNEALAVLHAILDDRGVIDVPGYDRIYLHEATRFIGTMNYGYVGTKELNEALVSRFTVIQVPQLDNDGIVKLLHTKYPEANLAKLGYFAKVFTDLQTKAKNGEISTRSVDLRGIIDALGMINRGIMAQDAMTYCVTNKAFDEFERTKVTDLIKATIAAKWGKDEIFGAGGRPNEVSVDFSGVKGR